MTGRIFLGQIRPDTIARRTNTREGERKLPLFSIGAYAKIVDTEMVDTWRVKRRVEMEMLSRNRCPLSGVAGNKIRHQAPGFRSLGTRHQAPGFISLSFISLSFISLSFISLGWRV
jgi:hypothetical protein